MSSLIPNSTQVPNYIIDTVMPDLTDTSFRVLIVIVRQTFGWLVDPITGRRKERDWIAYSQLVKKTGRSTKPIARALRELEDKSLIEIYDERGNQLKKNDNKLGKKLFYRVATKNVTLKEDFSSFQEGTSLQRKEVDDNLFTKENLLSKDTKLTNTKTSLLHKEGRVTTSCPLLNGSPLKEKYPNGHTECVEYLISEEEDRTSRFINRDKQFQFIHKILRAGYGFDAMDKTIRLVEKKYGPGTWDYGTLANWLEKGSSA